MGRTDYETGAGKVGGRSRSIRQFAGVDRTGSNELSEAAPQRPRGNHSARRPGTLRNCPQHPAHGLGASHLAKAGRGNSAKPLRVWRGRPRPRKAGFYVTARRDSRLPRPRRISKEIKKDSPEPPKAVPNKPSRLEGQLSPRYPREIAGVLRFRESPMNSIR